MRSAIFLLVLAIAAPAFAEEDEPLLLMLEEALPDPGSAVTVITREEIERNGSPFVLDLLRSIPGLHVFQAGSAGKTATASARGSRPEQVQVWIDGARVNGALLPVDLAHLSTTNVERIEVTRGPQGAPYGSAAMGAVIRIFTRYAGPLAAGRAEYGSDHTRRGSIRAGVGSNANHLAFAIERYDTDGQKANDDYRNDTISARAKVMITQWTSLALEFRDTGTEGGLPIGKALLRRDTSNRLISVPFQQQVVSWLSLEARFSHLDQEVNDDNARTRTFSIAGHFRPTKEHDLIAGYEQEDFETSFGTVDLPEVHNKAFFTEYRFQPSGQWQAVASMRVDDDDVHGSQFSPRISAAYNVRESLRLRGALGTGYRRAAFTELTVLPAQRDRVTGFDLGADFSAASTIRVSASFFHNRFSDSAAFLDHNATGIEVEATTEPWKGIRPRANYTFTDTGSNSQTPEHSGYIGLGYSWRDVHMNFDWYLNGSSITGDDFQRADFTAGYRLPWALEAYGRITNVFDSEYAEITGFPAPDRAFYFGIRYH